MPISSNSSKPNSVVVQLIIIVGVTLAFMFIGTLLGVIFNNLVYGVSLTDFALGSVDATNVTKKKIYAMKSFQLFSTLGLFFLPAITLPFVLFKKSSIEYLAINKKFKVTTLIFGFISFICLLPLIELTIQWNENINFPEGLKNIEQIIKSAEEDSKQALNLILKGNTWYDIASNIFIICILAAVTEELFFRGFLQRYLYEKTASLHVSVIFTAIVFSAIHFQFYGFVPRLLLGAFFGYVYFYSRTIWIPIILHFANNFLSLMIFYLYQNNISSINPDDALELPLYVYFLATIILIYIFYLFIKSTGPKLSKIQVTETGSLKDITLPEDFTSENNWVCVYSTTLPHLAEVIIGNLESSNIPAVKINKRDSSYGGFGQVEIHVPKNFEIRARLLIDN